VYLWFERSVTPGWGLFGGGTAVGPDVIFNPGQTDERHLLKANALWVKPGDVLRMQTGGGGGFGSAYEREVGRVQADVLDGYVSRAAATDRYGVIFNDDLSINTDQTTQRRENHAST
jgi:N-methylhydantoinase B